MVKHLQKHGNSLALVIDKPILELLKIDQDTPLEIEISENPLGLRIVPVPGVSDEKLDAALAKGNRKYGRMLKRLAE
jgi:antitoxin component of MazEF toxin-antitoxin module